jgi:predicted amidohydrolase YtcJ
MSDVLLFNGTILTMDEQRPAATAMALQGGRVLAVGGDEVLAFRRDRTELVDLGGRTACPGFIDAHHHLSLAAWYERGIDLAGCRSSGEALGRIAAHLVHPDPSLSSSEGEIPWIYAFNYRPRDFSDRSRITRYHLDGVAGDRPAIVMHFSFHEAVLSSTGLRVSGIARQTRDPLGGRIVRDRHGEPTGELLETAVGPVEARARASAAGTGYKDWLQAIERYCRNLFAAGITYVCDPGIDAMLEGYLRRARKEGRLVMPVSMLFVSGSGLFQPPLDRLTGPLTGDRLDGLGVGALKLFADGGSRCAVCVGLRESLSGVIALVGRAARLRRPALLMNARSPEVPHLDRTGRVRMGYLHYQPVQLAAICRDAHERGFQIAVHAACNAGIDAVLEAYEPLPRGRYRHRVEHLVSLDRDQARRLAATGAVGVVQPAYIAQLGDEWEAMPVPARLHSVPLRSLLDAGVTLAGSSDAPIAPYSPLSGMEAAITRRTRGGLTHQAEQAITPLEALHMWTVGAAAAANLSGEIGVLRSGARADVAVLSANPLTASRESLGRIRVERTLLAGRTVFSISPDPTTTQSGSSVFPSAR